MHQDIMLLLKEETAWHHRKVEENDFAQSLRDDTLTQAQYVTYLQKWFGFYQPLELDILHRPEWQEWKFDYTSRVKLPLIESDLLKLGLSQEDINRLPLCKQLPKIQSFSQVLGCLYVLEGSTLGGQFIMKKLQQSISIDPEKNGQFLNSYGQNVRKKWKGFGELLQVNAQMTENANEIVQAAKETFSYIDEWLKK